MSELTVPFDDRIAGPYVATAGQTVFDYDFPLLNQADILVTRKRAGAQANLVLGVDYTVQGVGAQDGGTITLVTGATLGDELVLYGARAVERTTDFQPPPNAPNATDFNAELDRYAVMLQEMFARVNRSLVVDKFSANFDARSLKIENLANGVASADAINFSQLAAAQIGVPVNVTALSEKTLVSDETDLGMIADAAAGFALKKFKPKNIGFTPAGTDALLRTLQGKLRGTRDLFDHIPEALHTAIKAFASTTDVAAYIQKAIDDAPDGARLEIPLGKCSYLGAGTQAFLFGATNKAIHFEGCGFGSWLDALPGFPDTRDHIRVAPTIGTRDWSFKGFRLVGPTARGRHGMHFDYTAAGNVASTYGVEIDHLLIDPTADGVSLYLHSTAANATGGFFYSQIRGGFFDSILGEYIGDTVLIEEPTITAGAGIAIDISQIAGAGNLKIDHPTLANRGAQIVIRSGVKPTLLDVTGEAIDELGGNNAMIDITGDVAPVLSPLIVNPQLQTNPALSLNPDLIRLGNVRGAIITPGRLAVRGLGKHINITNQAEDTHIEAGATYVTDDVIGAPAITNNGTRTTYGLKSTVRTGISGGVPFFDTNGNLGSSAALNANGLLIAGGAGAAPFTGNIGVDGQVLQAGTGQAPLFTSSPYIGTSLDLGHATDTTFTRIAPGRAAIEGSEIALLPRLALTTAGNGASLIGIEDAGSYFSQTTVETALAFIGARIASLDAAVVLRGAWAANAGTFPGSGTAQAGDSYVVSTGGTVDGVVFVTGDRIIALTDNASTSTYASNWLKADYTDLVASVAGKTGAVTLVAADISNLGTGVATWLATPSSANLAAAVTGETGTGALVFGTSPQITTPDIVGTVAVGNANAGSVGEHGITTVLSAARVTLANNIAADLVSRSLTAGDYLVWGNAYFEGTAAGSYINASISLVSNTIDGTGNGRKNTLTVSGSGISLGLNSVIPPVRINISATTTVYLVGQAGFSADAAFGFGSLSVLRIR